MSARSGTCLAATLVAASLMLSAAPASALTVGSFVPVQIQKPPDVYTEIPPEILPGGRRLSYYLSSDRALRCDTPVTETPFSAAAIDCQSPGRSLFQLDGDDAHAAPASMPAGREHRRNYYGIFSAAHARTADGAFSVVTAVHGENKNVTRGGRFYQNSVYRGLDALVPPLGNCVSGYATPTSIYTDCEAAYSGFVGTAVTPVDATTNWGLAPTTDLGPAVWPIGGYADNGGLRRLDHGVRHPSIINGGDGFLYMYYYDDGLFPGNVRGGFRVARAPEQQLGRGWQTWVEARRAWVDSLPAGPIGPQSSTAALAQPSPAADSTPLFDSGAKVMTVARVTGRRGFVGIDQGANPSQRCTTLDGREDFRGATRIRVSADAVHWSPPVDLQGPGFADCDFFASAKIAYPRFLNAAGTSTKQVSLDDFSLIGTQYGGQVFRVRLSIPELAIFLPRDQGSLPPDPNRAGLDGVIDPVSRGNTVAANPSGASTPLIPRVSLTVRAKRSRTGSGRPVIDVRIKRCGPGTSAVRVKVANKLRTMPCGAHRQLEGLRPGARYRLVTQPIRLNAAKQTIATGRKSRRIVRLLAAKPPK